MKRSKSMFPVYIVWAKGGSALGMSGAEDEGELAEVLGENSLELDDVKLFSGPPLVAKRSLSLESGASYAGFGSSNGDSAKKRGGRPKGSKNKPKADVPPLSVTSHLKEVD